MATIIDIAKEAGVSFKTVSRVLNGETGVRQSTRDRVIQAAKALNYSANIAARNLRAKKPKSIALFLNNPSQSYSQSVQLGALRGCQNQGLFLRVHDSIQSKEILSLIQTMEDGAYDVAGLILAPPLSDDLLILEAIEKTNLSFVRLGTEHPGAAGLRLSIDDQKAAQDMTAYLIAQGHKNIGFIKGPDNYRASHLRWAGFQNAMRMAELDITEAYIGQGDFSYASGLQAAETILTPGIRPSAIFAANDEMAAGCLAAAYKLDIRVPDHLSIAGIDDAPVATSVYPSLTTIRQSIAEMVEKAVEQLCLPGDIQKTALLLPHELIERESTAPVP